MKLQRGVQNFVTRNLIICTPTFVQDTFRSLRLAILLPDVHNHGLHFIAVCAVVIITYVFVVTFNPFSEIVR